MQSLDRTISNKIANASIVCALLVILIHTNTSAPDGAPIWWLHRMISSGVGRMAVPFFFAVSGYLFASHFNDDDWWVNENKKRVKSLLVPYLCWSAVYIAIVTGTRVMANLYAGRDAFDADISCSGFYLKAFGFSLDEPMLVPLWYVRGLIIVVFLSPIIKALLRLRMWALLGVFAFEFVFYRYLPSMKGSVFRCLIPSVGILYFTVGAYLRMNDWSGRFFSRGKSWCLLLAGVCLMAVRNYLVYHGGENWPEYFSFVAVPLLCVGLWGVISGRQWPKWFTSCAFPIYLCHPIVNWPHYFLPCHDWLVKTTAGWFVHAACLIVGSIAVAMLLRRFMPRAAKMLFGGR